MLIPSQTTSWMPVIVSMSKCWPVICDHYTSAIMSAGAFLGSAILAFSDLLNCAEGR